MFILAENTKAHNQTRKTLRASISHPNNNACSHGSPFRIRIMVEVLFSTKPIKSAKQRTPMERRRASTALAFRGPTIQIRFHGESKYAKQIIPIESVNNVFYALFQINGFDNAIIKIARINLDTLTYDEAMDIAFNTDSVTSYLTDKKIRITNFVHYPGIEAILNIFVDKVKNPKKDDNENEKVVNE